MSVLDEYRAFGVAILLPSFSFSVEIPVNAIAPSLELVDDRYENMLVEQADEDDEPVEENDEGDPLDEDEVECILEDRKVQLALADALEMGNAIVHGQLEADSGISEIIFAILYVYERQEEFEGFDHLRGIVGYLCEHGVEFRPCYTDAEYMEIVKSFKNAQGDDDGDGEGEDEEGPRHTIH